MQRKDSNILAGHALWPIKWSLLALPLGGLLFCGFLIAIPSAFAFVISFPNMMNFYPTFVALFIQMIQNPVALGLSEYAFIIPALIILGKYRRPFKERILLLGWKPYFGNKARAPAGWPRFLKDISASFIIGLSLYGFVYVTSGVIYNFIPDAYFSIRFELNDLPRNIYQLVLFTATYLLAVGPAEELLFRGFTQQGLEARIGEKRAFLIASLIFALSHAGIVYVDFDGFLLYFCISLVLCGIYCKTKDLNRMIYMHGIYDAINSFLVYVQLVYPSMGIEGFAYMSIGTCGALVLFMCIRWLCNQVNGKKIHSNQPGLLAPN